MDGPEDRMPDSQSSIVEEFLAGSIRTDSSGQKFCVSGSPDAFDVQGYLEDMAAREAAMLADLANLRFVG